MSSAEVAGAAAAARKAAAAAVARRLVSPRLRQQRDAEAAAAAPGAGSPAEASADLPSTTESFHAALHGAEIQRRAGPSPYETIPGHSFPLRGRFVPDRDRPWTGSYEKSPVESAGLEIARAVHEFACEFARKSPEHAARDVYINADGLRKFLAAAALGDTDLAGVPLGAIYLTEDRRRTTCHWWRLGFDARSDGTLQWGCNTPETDVLEHPNHIAADGTMSWCDRELFPNGTLVLGRRPVRCDLATCHCHRDAEAPPFDIDRELLGGEGPAMVAGNGDRFWLRREWKLPEYGRNPPPPRKELHRSGDRPAFISSDGRRVEYTVKGQLSRKNDRPAVVVRDAAGRTVLEEFYEDGVFIRRVGAAPAAAEPMAAPAAAPDPFPAAVATADVVAGVAAGVAAATAATADANADAND